MDERALRELVEQVERGRLSRRRFVQTLVGLGLTAPMATALLGSAGVAAAQPRESAFTPARRGGGGDLRVLMWDAPTLLHPHFGRGLRDVTASRLFYEPLAAAAPDGTFAPVLADEIPTRKNGGLSRDGQSVTWRLKRNVTWHDGAPFTADDVIFNWQFAVDPANATSSRAGFEEVARRIEQGGKGRALSIPSPAVSFIQCNQSDPWSAEDGERCSPKSSHPFLSDQAVRTAVSLLVDRVSIHEHVLGRTGRVTANFLNAPDRFRSPNTSWEFSIDKANQILDQAGWVRGADGIRAKDAKRLKIVFQAAANSTVQKVQAVVKQAAARAGIEIEIKAIPASVFFSSDVSNLDTNVRFLADLQTYTTFTGLDPQFFMAQFVSWELPSRENNWTGRNIARWRNTTFDQLWRQAEVEMDPVKRAALFIKMNDIVVQSAVVVPVTWRNVLHAAANTLG